MNESLIRWTKSDRENLRKAVRNYNAKITRLEKKGLENLPQKIDYKALRYGTKATYDKLGNVIEHTKYGILSRNELRNTINSLKRFSSRGSEKIVTLDSGEKITSWERREIGYKKARATRYLNKRIEEVSNKSTFGMGNKEKQELIAQKESLQNIDNTRGYEFRRKLGQLNYQARSDKELVKAEIWKTNFMSNLDTLSTYDHFDLLEAKLKSIKNPIKLYEFISESEIMKDFFLWYNETPTSNTIAGFSDNQEAFDYALSELGILM